MNNKFNRSNSDGSVAYTTKGWFSNIFFRRRTESEQRFQEIMAELRDIKDSVEIISQQVARWSRVLPEE